MNGTKQKIVVIGGGSGNFVVLSGLVKHPVDLTAIVTMSDDGGSTGILRDELGVLPPGDVRQCLVALSQDSTVLRDLFNYRYGEGGLEGHSFGNIFISTLEKITGRFDKAVIEASRILRIKGYVLPVTLENTRLIVNLKNGEQIIGEKNIEKYKGGFSSVEKIYLEPEPKLNPKISKAIKEADKIIISPGDLYTSLIPNFLVKGLSECIAKSKAKIIYVVNLMTELNQTDSFSSVEYINELEKYIGKGVIKYAIFNKEFPEKGLLKKYCRIGEKPVEKGDISQFPEIIFLEHNLLSHKIHKVDEHDHISEERSLIRHDSDKLAKVIYEI